MLEDHLPSRADQKIVFFERTWALGAYFGLKKKIRIKKGMSMDILFVITIEVLFQNES
jgi:hypothetical protein